MNTIAVELLNSGLVDWRRKNNLGKSALDYARENQMTQIIDIIEDNIKKNQNIFSNPYNCENYNNKSENTNIFNKKEITINNFEDLPKIFDILKNIKKK